MADSFGDRVAAAAARTGPLCAGIDPSSALLEAWGLRDSAEGLRTFCAICVEGFADVVSVVKPQVAFFERHGSAGLAELERLIAEATAAGLIVIADAKRGDIDSTAAAYADAWLGQASPLGVDAMTVHPYLGLGALAPLVRLASANGKGVLVVARSSNPEGRDLQQAVTRRRFGRRGHAPGRNRRAEPLTRGPGGHGGCGGRGDLGAVGFRVIPARRGNSGARVRRPGCRPDRRGRAFCGVPARNGAAEQLPRPPEPGSRRRHLAGQRTLAEPRIGGGAGLKRGNGYERPWLRRYGLAMPQPPALTPEQRGAALEKAARVRRERAEVKDKLKMGNLSLADLLQEADSNETIGKMKVVSVLESLPGLGKVKARRLMETVGISDSRRLQGLGAKQREALLKETAR